MKLIPNHFEWNRNGFSWKNLTPFLGSENGTDFGPDPRTRTVHPRTRTMHIHSFVNITVLQILHMYVIVCLCMYARARLHASARAPTRRHLRQGWRVCARSSGCVPSTPTCATCPLVFFGIAALSPRARKPLPKFVRQRLISGGTEIDFFKNFGNICDEKCTHKFKLKNIQICATEIDFLCNLNCFFRKKLDPIFGVRNWPQNLGRKLTPMYSLMYYLQHNR